MKKYTSQTVFDYLLGNDIQDFDIDELENNSEFMADVVCKDKNAYNLCSDSIKSDFGFTKKVIEKYNSDVKFAIKVFDNFSNLNKKHESNEELEDELFELNIMMRKITKNEDNMTRLPYVMATDISFSWNQLAGEAQKEQSDEVTKKSIGLGFAIQQERYAHNKTILNYIAERYIEQIFFEAMDLELNLHNMYRRYQDYEQAGKYAVIVKYLSFYDYDLAMYVAKNAETLMELNKEINRIKNNWSTYNCKIKKEERNESDKYNNIISRVRNYCEENNTDFDHYDAMGYFAERFGVKKELEAHCIHNDDIINITNMMIDDKEISEEDGNEIIDNTIEEIKEMKENGENDNLLDNEFTPFKDKEFIKAHRKELDDIRRIFTQELGFTLKDVKEGKIQKKEKSDTKVLQFKIKPLNK